MRENRKHTRVAEQDSVAVTVLASPGAEGLVNRTVFCTTEDLSAGGIRLRASVRIPSGSTVEMRVAVARPLKAFRQRGRVVWANEAASAGQYVLGVEFLEAKPGDLDQWRGLVSQRLQTNGA
jgi:c-di-GMP-binding flagellar brake protein YcgR